MVENVRTLQKDIDRISIKLKSLTSKQINHQVIKNDCKKVVDFYFRNVRSNDHGSNDYNSSKLLDDIFQNLLLLTHKKSLKSRYRKVLSELKQHLVSLETEIVSDVQRSNRNQAIDKTDIQIIQTLKNFINSAALSYEQAIIDLQGQDRLSWRGPASDLRESLRECLDHLAPDNNVINQPGFKLEPDTKGPTMKQKVKFILKSRKKGSSEIQTSENSIDLVDEMMGKFVRSVYTRASVSTHTNSEKNEVHRILRLVRNVFCEILEIN